MNNISRSDIERSLINTARELWRQRFLWLKELIVSILCDFRDLSYVIQHLNDNIEDFADEFMKYFGYYNSKIFESLCKDNTLITVKILKDIKARNTNAADADRIEWYKNADEIAGFLSSINHHWDKQVWQNLIYDHLKLIENEAVNGLNTRCTTDITTQEEIDNQILKMADYTANGLIQQFLI